MCGAVLFSCIFVTLAVRLERTARTSPHFQIKMNAPSSCECFWSLTVLSMIVVCANVLICIFIERPRSPRPFQILSRAAWSFDAYTYMKREAGCRLFAGFWVRSRPVKIYFECRSGYPINTRCPRNGFGCKLRRPLFQKTDRWVLDPESNSGLIRNVLK